MSDVLSSTPTAYAMWPSTGFWWAYIGSSQPLKMTINEPRLFEKWEACPSKKCVCICTDALHAEARLRAWWWCWWGHVITQRLFKCGFFPWKSLDSRNPLAHSWIVPLKCFLYSFKNLLHGCCEICNFIRGVITEGRILTTQVKRGCIDKKYREIQCCEKVFCPFLISSIVAYLSLNCVFQSRLNLRQSMSTWVNTKFSFHLIYWRKKSYQTPNGLCENCPLSYSFNQ